MQILVLAPFDDNVKDRVSAIERLGYNTIPFDTAPYRQSGIRLERSIAHRFNLGSSLRRLNIDLVCFSREIKYDLVWVDKGVWIYPETVAVLKERSTFNLAVHFTPDAQFNDNRSRHFFNGIQYYDLFVTTKPHEISQYRSHGAVDVLRIEQGYGARCYPGAGSFEVRQKLSAEVCFIGRTEPHYIEKLRTVKSQSTDLAIWGAAWPKYAQQHSWAHGAVRGAGLWGTEYAAALGASKISLGLLTKRSPETTTTRSFEIPASGGFLLAERTSDHMALFAEGHEAEFFESDAEMLEKIRFYLTHDAARCAIARAGRLRCEKSGYDLKSQLAKVFYRLSKEHCSRVSL